MNEPRCIGPYEILGVLGSGGMGVVYRGRHVETGELAAVKTVRVASEAQLSGIRREIRALARASHPGVVRTLADGLADGVPWYAMELLEGVTLLDYVVRRSSGHPAQDAEHRPTIAESGGGDPAPGHTRVERRTT